MDFSDSSDTKVSKATHKGIIQDGYHSFNLFNYILLMLYWQMHLFHTMTRISILRHIVNSNLFLR
jgi:hypothetical protein